MTKKRNQKQFRGVSRISWNTNLSTPRQAAIQEWLDAKGMTRRELAVAMGVDPSLLTLIFHGRRRVTDQRRGAFEALGFPMHVLGE